MIRNQRKIIIPILIAISFLVMINSSYGATISMDAGNFSKTTIEGANDDDIIELGPILGDFDLNSSNVNISISKTITIKSSNPSQNAVININQLGRLSM